MATRHRRRRRGRALAGVDSDLQAHVEAFGHVGEELRGLLVTLQAKAINPTAAQRLHELWPGLMEQLAPDVRDLDPRNGVTKRAYGNFVDELDRALLLVPPDNLPDWWPLQETFKIGISWLRWYKAMPQVADRAITFIGRTVGIREPVGVMLGLAVLGDDTAAIRRGSDYAVPWLELVLKHPPTGKIGAQARSLMDRLAGAGFDDAIAVQRRLES